MLLKFSASSENMAIWAQNKVRNISANMAADTELKYTKLSYISKLCVESMFQMFQNSMEII
jgi:hypothetical protein